MGKTRRAVENEPILRRWPADAGRLEVVLPERFGFAGRSCKPLHAGGGVAGMGTGMP